MTRVKAITLLSLFYFVCIFQTPIFGWNNEITHRDLSEYAAHNSVLDPTKGDYVKNLGLRAGLKEKLTWNDKTQVVVKWIRDGADYEDAGNTWQLATGQTRSYNHFHNPLKQYPWTDAGLDDWIALPPFHTTGESFVLWAQDSNNQNNAVGGDWSWQNVRSLYYYALTAQTESDRQTYFANTFEGLGNQMHLVQDAGQPDHVRNDAHPLDGGGVVVGMETWAKNNRLTINSFAANQTYPNVSFNVSQGGLVPITQLSDTDQYNGLNPSAGNNQGLAEYTNANFFSDDTILAAERYSTTDRHYFPFPKETSTDLADYLSGNKATEPFTDRDGNTKTGIWISKVGDGEYVHHFLKPSLLTRFLYNTAGESALFFNTFSLDEACHNDYAALLIPRAVGYSAELLNYFFRGTIDISIPTNGLYSMVDATQPGFDPSTAGFTSVKLMATNTTANGENMTNGTIQLVVKYKVAHVDPFQPGPVETDADFSYVVIPEKDNVSALPNATPTELNFDLSQKPIPLWATDVYLQVVFKGTLGKEYDAVAVGFKDISEPTPIDLFSNTDMICINGSWYVAGSQEAIAQVDANNNEIADYPDEGDVYRHDPQDIYILFSPYSETAYRIASPTFYDFKVSGLTPANLMRPLYILSGYEFDDTSHVHWVNANPDDNWPVYDQKYLHIDYSIKRQTEYSENSGLCGDASSCYFDYYPDEATSFPYYETPEFYNFRGALMWWGAPQIHTNYPYPDGSQCSYDSL